MAINNPNEHNHSGKSMQNKDHSDHMNKTGHSDHK